MKRLAVFLLFVACFASRAVAFGLAPSTDPRGIVTTHTYDVLGRELTRSVGSDTIGTWIYNDTAETAANLVTLGGYGGFKEGLADNSAYEGPLGGLKAYGRGVRNFVTVGYYDPIAKAKEGEGAAAALQHTKDITGWTKYEQFGTHLGEGEYLEATGDLLVGMGQTAGTILAGKGAITAGKGLLTKTEAGVESVTAPSKLTNREYIPDDVTESVAAKRVQPANSVQTPRPLLALPAPKPQLALPAPKPQLALPAPEPQLALPAGNSASISAEAEAASTPPSGGRSLVKRDFDTIAPNRGFLGDYRVKEILQPDAIIDRFGRRGGSFASPEGTPFSARGIPPENAQLPYERFKVLKAFEVDAGIAVYAYGGGGGVQYELPASIQALIDDKVITEAK